MMKLGRGGAGALPQSQQLFFGEVVLLMRLGLLREKAMGPGPYEGTSLLHDAILSSFEGKEKESRRPRQYVYRRRARK